MRARAFGALVALCSMAAAPEIVQKFRAVVFADATPLARNDELISRMFSPFIREDLTKKNDARTLRAFPIEPRAEMFGMFVPAKRPAGGYGLLVWISPLDEIGMPPGWAAVLEDRGVIFVTAGRSGNLTSPLDRRIPLALIAATNVARLHSTNPNRVWIAGFSGGSRIAQRMALAYPDLFSGAILDGSADDIGEADVPLPPRENFERLLDRTAVVFSSGEWDTYNAAAAKGVASSLRRLCIDRVSVEARRAEGHVMMSGRSLAKAIEFLDQKRAGPSPDNRKCREELYSRIDGEIARAEAMVEHGSRGAREAIRSLDRRYGGLAAPRSLELRARAGG